MYTKDEKGEKIFEVFMQSAVTKQKAFYFAIQSTESHKKRNILNIHKVRNLWPKCCARQCTCCKMSDRRFLFKYDSKTQFLFLV
jgi:hypothetical protein